jgi:hypothetical protein
MEAASLSFFSQTRMRAAYHYIKKKNRGLETAYNTIDTPTLFTRHKLSLFRQRPEAASLKNQMV